MSIDLASWYVNVLVFHITNKIQRPKNWGKHLYGNNKFGWKFKYHPFSKSLFGFDRRSQDNYCWIEIQTFCYLGKFQIIDFLFFTNYSLMKENVQKRFFHTKKRSFNLILTSSALCYQLLICYMNFDVDNLIQDGVVCELLKLLLLIYNIVQIYSLEGSVVNKPWLIRIETQTS